MTKEKLIELFEKLNIAKLPEKGKIKIKLKKSLIDIYRKKYEKSA
jgi:hypothetical protein